MSLEIRGSRYSRTITRMFLFSQTSGKDQVKHLVIFHSDFQMIFNAMESLMCYEVKFILLDSCSLFIWSCPSLYIKSVFFLDNHAGNS